MLFVKIKILKMKKLTSIFAFVIISNLLFAQFSRDTIETKRGTKIINYEIGFNYQTFGGVFLGGAPSTLSLNVTYKKLQESGNALRYSLNFERDNNFYLDFNQNTIEISPTQKKVLNTNRDDNMTLLGFGWEYRKPTENKHTLLFALDALVGYKNTRENFNETIYKANGDSSYYAGNSSILLPDYDFEGVNQLQSYNAHSLALGVRSHMGVLWSLSERFTLTTAMEVRGLYTMNSRHETNNVTDEKSISNSSTLDLNQKIIGDFSLFYRF